MHNNRGQEEMMGFAMIVVIVAVIGLVFLGIAARQEAPQTGVESRDLQYFIESALQTTTSCALRFVPDYASVAELIVACAGDAKTVCISDQVPVCRALNTSLQQMIAQSWPVSSEHPSQGYDLNITFTTVNQKIPSSVLTMHAGNCTQEYRSAQTLLRESKSRGSIQVTMKICP